MTIHPAFPIPVDSATAAWATPVFVLMALTTVAVLIWQAVRYFRDSDSDSDRDGHGDSGDETTPGRDDARG